MSACYEHDSFASVLSRCNFVGVPLLGNPRERGLVAGSLLHALPAGEAAAGRLSSHFRQGGQLSCLGRSSSPL